MAKGKRQKKKKIVYFDLDGTVGDWDGSMRRDLTAMIRPGEPPLPDVLDPHQPDIRDRCEIIKGQHGWWRNLARLEDGFRLFELVQSLGFKVQVLTKGPRKFPMAWAEKVAWCAEHMPGIGVNIVMNKENVIGDVLVDDFPPYVSEWLAAHEEGLVIMPDRPWNQYYHHSRAIRYSNPLGQPIAAIDPIALALEVVLAK